MQAVPWRRQPDRAPPHAPELRRSRGADHRVALGITVQARRARHLVGLVEEDAVVGRGLRREADNVLGKGRVAQDQHGAEFGHGVVRAHHGHALLQGGGPEHRLYGFLHLLPWDLALQPHHVGSRGDTQLECTVEPLDVEIQIREQICVAAITLNTELLHLPQDAISHLWRQQNQSCARVHNGNAPVAATNLLATHLDALYIDPPVLVPDHFCLKYPVLHLSSVHKWVVQKQVARILTRPIAH
mmetsp:Transcript_48950/g.106567  ORF Transcript_48950/g.106567 Transcript_48950/m.106567 type:complete len:243 (-) Transcript_48950:709-1437(-)